MATPLLLACLSAHANAGYVVVDDTRPLSNTQQSMTDRHSIPFAQGRAPLGPLGRAALNVLVPLMQNQKVRIVGRPDATPSRLAEDRANSIRSFLIKKGAQPAAITIEINNTPNQRPKGGNYACEVYMGGQSAARFSPLNTPRPSSYSQPGQTALPAGSKATQQQIIQYIGQIALENQMDPIAALKAIQLISNAEMGSNNAPGRVVPVAYANPTVDRVQNLTWQLETSKTLRGNIDAWALGSGWNATIWNASDEFQVSKSSTLHGDFIAVLRQIADETQLNICAYQRSKTIKVTDPQISCKD